MLKLRAPLFALVASVLISACGFHLAGYYEVPEELRQVNLVIPADRPSGVRTHLTSLLEINGIEITDTANYRLEVLDENIRRRSLSTSIRADTVEYELIGTAHFSVSNRAGELLITNREVRAERVFNNNENTTARDALQSQIERALEEQLAQQIVRQYLSLK
ncbi:LPS assembly lipoprotein LptE [Marinobacterium mangrovicola]|uniref:LPS-assembly lipoprotein LptE n=1 Tax=Marinobacterium mangrovicola TaxID=1476959 RepID=A0A4R1GLC6_9GAMM|nr:LPS assembly lipoprotein LptE [Marinobacterium mangrovicola]TCK06889.1 LPS-assembly lipoprotein [Marinobacterium mangrovicola]